MPPIARQEGVSTSGSSQSRDRREHLHRAQAGAPILLKRGAVGYIGLSTSGMSQTRGFHFYLFKR
eukprot:8955810-Pyramimonas_sp.AAC.1